jgi:hypothetical protein
VSITLGKDCSISAGGSIGSARSVTVSETARTIDIEQFGSRFNSVYSTGYDASVSIELNDGSDASSLITACQNGTSITVSGGTGGWSFPAVVTGVSETFSIDGVATFTIEAKMTKEGLK